MIRIELKFHVWQFSGGTEIFFFFSLNMVGLEIWSMLPEKRTINFLFLLLEERNPGQIKLMFSFYYFLK